MKARIIIGDKFQDIEVENFEVSYNKYEDIDLFVLLTPKVFIKDEGKKNVKTEAIGVAKPSSQGIISDDDMFSVNIPVGDLFGDSGKQPALIMERQKQSVNWYVGDIAAGKFIIKEENRVIRSEVFKFTESNIVVFIDTIKKAIKQLVEREKTFAGDYFLYAIKEPHVIFGDILDNKDREFYVLEQVSKVQLIDGEGESLEDSPKES